MKKIINGKMYDTKIAEELASRCENCRSFSYVSEGLYRTKKGAYFLAGEGGPCSRYGVPDEDGTGADGGQDIIPISEEAARQWMETHADVDAYVAAFGEPEEA